MKTQSKQSRVMSMAWRLFKMPGNNKTTFSEALRAAWGRIKSLEGYVPMKLVNVFINNLKLVDLKSKEGKGTSEFWSIANSRQIRKTEDPEIKEMIDKGEIPFVDILKIRRRKQATFKFVKKPEKVKRPRIIRNIDAYVATV